MDTIENHRLILVLEDEEQHLDLHLMVVYHMEFQIHVIDYHHYLSIDKDHPVTSKYKNLEFLWLDNNNKNYHLHPFKKLLERLGVGVGD
jgi:hypothetical protein